MRRYNINAPITDTALNYINQNFITLFNEYIQAGNNAREALVKAEQSVRNSLQSNVAADEAKSIAERVSEELGQAILNGDSSPLAGQLTVGGDGTVHKNPQERFINEMNSVNQQLTQEANQRAILDDKSFYGGLTFNRNPKATLVLVDDDGYPQVHNLLKPLAESENVPITTAIITSRVGTSTSSMTLEQIKECQESGMEVVSHTHTHRRLSDLSPAEQEEDIRLAKEYLQRHGFNHDVLVYPFGAADKTTEAITERYHRLGVYIDYGQHRLNFPPILQYRLERVYYNDQQGNNYVQRCKDKIDEAIASNGFLVIGMHCFYSGFDLEGLREVIRYAKQKGIEISTFKKAIENYGNIINLPDFQMGANGRIISRTIGKYTLPRRVENFNGNNLLVDYNEGTTMTMHSTAITYEGMPVASGSIMFTHKGLSSWLSYQEVFVKSNRNRYVRTWNNGGFWNAWLKTYPEPTPIIPEQYYHEIGGSFNINGNMHLDEFEEGTTVSTHSSTRGYEGLPVASLSVMRTHKPISGELFAYQDLFVISNKNRYARTWSRSNSTWSEWELV